jgi:hypothetical protein
MSNEDFTSEPRRTWADVAWNATEWVGLITILAVLGQCSSGALW